MSPSILFSSLLYILPIRSEWVSGKLANLYLLGDVNPFKSLIKKQNKDEISDISCGAWRTAFLYHVISTLGRLYVFVCACVCPLSLQMVSWWYFSYLKYLPPLSEFLALAPETASIHNPLAAISQTFHKWASYILTGYWLRFSIMLYFEWGSCCTMADHLAGKRERREKKKKGQPARE